LENTGGTALEQYGSQAKEGDVINTPFEKMPG